MAQGLVFTFLSGGFCVREKRKERRQKEKKKLIVNLFLGAKIDKPEIMYNNITNAIVSIKCIIVVL